MNEPNPQNQRLKTVGSPEKGESSDFSEVWAVIKLDYQMPGEFAKDSSGHNYLEGDLNRPRWKQASAFAHTLSHLIEQSFNLDAGTVQCRMRLVQIRRQELQPQINFLVSRMRCPNKQKLKSISKLFSEEVCSQRNFKASNNEEGSELSSGDTERTIDAASIFLKANGGQSITRQMLVMVDKEDELKISGVWRTIPVEKQKESEIKTMRGFYDGRRLSTRTLFVREEGARGKNWEISYDEEKYDQVLRDLRDDKSAGLVIGYTESVVNKKIVMTLVSVECPEAPELFELSS